jgi:hypothetical protein
MTDAVGPVFAAGFQAAGKSGYTIQFLPDLHNDQLQREGKPPVYWWLPNATRLATKENGDFLFSFLHFVGVRSTDTTVGAQSADEEVSGGLLGFSVTMAPPDDVMKSAFNDIQERFRGNDDHFWGWRTPATPMFRPVPIVSNTTSVTNLSPNPDGSFPKPSAPAGGAPAGGGAGPPATGGGGPPPAAAGGKTVHQRSLPRQIGVGAPGNSVAMPRTVSPTFRGTNLDMWAFNLQGQGAGDINPLGVNSYSALVGSIPAALIWSTFHEGTSAFGVWQNVRMRVWSPTVHIHMEGDWDRVQDHFSAAASAGGWFWSADVQAEFNNLRESGGITTQIEVDQTLPGAEKLAEQIDKRSDLIFQKFMDLAQKTIFDPAPFKEDPAKASGGFLGLGGGVAVKVRQDRTHLHLFYDETREMAYLQDNVVPGQLDGLYDVLKQDPTQEKKYFTTVYLGDWDRKVTRTVKPVVNWPDPAQQWVGEPVSFLTVQVGYPNTEGVVQWDGHIFQRSDGPDAVWQARMEMKKEADVANAPAGWKADKTFVKRQVQLTEPPSALENPYARVQVEQNVIDLDPGDLGSLVDDINLAVRADTVGTLAVGPITLSANLEGSGAVVEVTLQAAGKRKDGQDHDPVKFSWLAADQDKPRIWLLYTGDPTFVPKYTYQVRVVVKGTIFSHGQEWIGPLQEGSGDGPLTASVPTADDPGVTKKALVFKGVPAPPRHALPHAAHDGHGPPAAVSGKPHPAAVGSGPPPALSPGHSKEIGKKAAEGWESREINPHELAGWGTAPPGQGGGP